MKSLPIILLAAALGAAVYAGYRGQVRRAAVLRHIVALDACLAAHNEQRAREATATVRGIAKSTCLHQHDARDLAVLRQAQAIRARTQSLLDTLRLLRQQLPAAGARALAAQLPARLDRFTALIEAAVPGTGPLTHASGAGVAEGWFGQFDVLAEPRPAATALLTRLATQLRRYEAAALQQQARKVGTNCICFDIIRPLAVPVSATVAPGADYQARLFLVLQGRRNAYDARMTANGQELTQMGRQGQLVSFAVPAARPGQPDTVRAQWQGRVQLGPYPTDTVLSVTVPYLIVKRLTL